MISHKPECPPNPADAFRERLDALEAITNDLSCRISALEPKRSPKEACKAKAEHNARQIEKDAIESVWTESGKAE